MEDHITLILHHGGDLVRNENRRLEYVGNYERNGWNFISDMQKV